VLKQPKKLLVRELWLHAISLLSLDKNVYLLFHWRLLSYYSPATVTRWDKHMRNTILIWLYSRHTCMAWSQKK
jgi:hypothetical protein